MFECTSDAALKQQVAGYVFRLHDRVSGLGFNEEVERHPARQVSVAVACALEGLNEAYAIARATQDDQRVERYLRCICVGLAYLFQVQCIQRCTERERGGFGMSLSERAQRIDVTGHAASAFMKSVENRIACSPAASPGRAAGGAFVPA